VLKVNQLSHFLDHILLDSNLCLQPSIISTRHTSQVDPAIAPQQKGLLQQIQAQLAQLQTELTASAAATVASLLPLL
jgi:hypothetical protein